ncbi:hypothetical protein NE237_016348 [Protea cynaroides]|uniref:Uncharacterized protein n=1 Tax=Protea cynaroides TaxID=273540 RepID=A0A9Q0GLD1_9MAGN|nr:hypothetical protein NE237_016348 [Protea cynaroides]
MLGGKEIFLPLLLLLCLLTATRPDATYVIDVGGSRSSTYFRRGAFFISISINIYTWMCCYFNKGLKELIQPSKRRHSSRRPEKDSISFFFLYVISHEFLEFGLSSAQKVAQLSKDWENREWWKRTDIELELPEEKAVKATRQYILWMLDLTSGRSTFQSC